MKIVENACLVVVAGVIATCILIAVSWYLLPPTHGLSFEQESSHWWQGLAEVLFGVKGD